MIIKAFNEEETVQAGVRLGAELQSGVFIALYGDLGAGKTDRKSTRLNSSHYQQSRMPSSA